MCETLDSVQIQQAATRFHGFILVTLLVTLLAHLRET